MGNCSIQLSCYSFLCGGIPLTLGLPWWLSSKESACQWRRWGLDPWVRKIPWRRKRQPTPVFLPGKSHGQKGLGGYSPWSLQRAGHDSSNLAATAEDAGSLGGCEGVSPSSAAGGWGGAQPPMPFESSTTLFHWRILFLCTGQFPRYSETLYLELVNLED